MASLLPPRIPTPSSLIPRAPTPTNSSSSTAGSGSGSVSGGSGSGNGKQSSNGSGAPQSSKVKNDLPPLHPKAPGGNKSSNSLSSLAGSRPGSRPGSQPNSRPSSPFFGLVLTPSWASASTVGGESTSGSVAPRQKKPQQQQGQGQPPPPPPLPLTRKDSSSTIATLQSTRSTATKNSTKRRLSKSKNARSNGRKTPTLPKRQRDALLSTFSSDSNLTSSTPPPLISPPTDEAIETIGGVGFCGALNCQFPRDDSGSSMGVNDDSVAGIESVDSGLLDNKKKGAAMENLDGYAALHDDIVTALIDEALRNGSNADSGGNASESMAAEAAGPAESQPPPLIEIGEKTPLTPPPKSSGPPSTPYNNAPLSPLSSSTKSSAKKSRTPYRMARTLSSVSTKIRKRQRSNVSGDDQTAQGKQLPCSSPLAKQYSSSTAIKQTMMQNLKNSGSFASSTPTKGGSQPLLSTPSDGNNHGIDTTPIKSNNAIQNPVVQYLHPQCILQKEAPKQKSKLSFGDKKDKNAGNDDGAPSAVGREATLEKLQKKLSMLGDIESGKFGKAAEMLRSDAVVFHLEVEDNDDNSRVSSKQSPNHSTKCETRSILTFKMGFVSMSYGILLQWDCTSKLVVLIVLRKMCREDFLKTKTNKGVDASMRSFKKKDLPSFSNKNLGGGGVGGKTDINVRPPPLMSPPSKKPELIPIPVTTITEVEESGGSTDVAEADDPAVSSMDWHESRSGSLLDLLPKLPASGLLLPGNPFAGLPKLLLGGDGSDVNDDDNAPQSFISVSVMNVKQLHGGCDHCRSPTYMGGVWSELIRQNHNDATYGGKSRFGNQSPRRRKRKQTIRPYIRFVLGKHEHCTKITKYNKGNPVWSMRHHNSCLLPCPPEEDRWFAGREDLIVEVRNDWRNPSHVNSQTSGGGLFSVKPKGLDNEDPILAVVTVPLSSVNIEDDENNNNNDDCASPASPSKKKKGSKGTSFRRRNTKSKDGASSTNITIPLRMSDCDHAPIGSISLNITIKVPPRPLGDNVKQTKHKKSPSLPKVDIIHINAGRGSASTVGGESKVNESIELGPLTRLIDGWSLAGGDAPVSKELEEPAEPAAAPSPPAKEKSTSKRGNQTRPTTSISSVAPNRSKLKSQKSRSRSRSKTRSTNSKEAGKKKKQDLRWSKQFDHETKKWSNLKSTSTDSVGTTIQTVGSSSCKTNGPSPSSRTSTEKKEEEGSGNNGNEGWFAFLTRESTRDIAVRRG